MYGLISSLVARPGRRDDLVALMRAGSVAMPGCLSYVIAHDAAAPDTIWVTEIWESAGHHEASLRLPQVAATIAEARPLIAGFGERFVTVPVAGTGF